MARKWLKKDKAEKLIAKLSKKQPRTDAERIRARYVKIGH